MEEFQKKDFAKLLKAGALEGRRWMRATDSEAVRIYDRNLEAFPVTVELFGKYAKVVDYSQEGMSEEDILQARDIISRMVYIEEDRIIFQSRKKREGLEQHSALDSEPLCLTVRENGLVFKVDLTSHIDTGLFLDQVNTRSLVRDMCRGLKVLNLFSYTGSFSVYAAAGGCESVVSVDMSNTYSRIAEENLRANEFLSEERYPCVVKDACVYIKEAEAKGEKFDIIIFDPPSFSNSHKMDAPFDIKKDYLDWCVVLNHLLSEDGVLIFSTNLSTFTLEKKMLKAAFQVREITEDIRAIGFVKSKAGQSRVWIMKKTAEMKAVRRKRTEKAVRREKMEEVKDSDLDRLVLSMDEKEEGGEKKAQERNRREERGERKFSSERKDDRKRSFSQDRRDDRGRDRDRRSSSDRPRYSEDRRRDSGFSRDRRDFRDRDSRPRYSDDRRSSYSDRPRYSEDRPRYNDDRRSSYSDRPRYNDERRSSYSDRPRYNDERRRDSDFSRDRRDFRDRDSRPRYSDDRRSSDRPRYSSDERPRFSRERRSVKPYGYDSIKKSRDRGDSGEDSGFFWRNKDEENKKND